MAIRSTVTSKNQITIPAAIVRELEIEPGMQLEWEIGETRAVVVRPVESRAELARRLQGKWRHLLKPDDDPIGDLIRERVDEDEEMESF